MLRALFVAIGVVTTVTACADSSCLTGKCELPCSEVNYSCEPSSGMYVGELGQAPTQYLLRKANGGSRDILLSNGKVSVVVNAIDSPIDLAPTGGTVIDFGPSGGVDEFTIWYQLSGILPGDAFAYKKLEIVDRSPESIAVKVTGTLDGHDDIKVVTWYELLACDQGLRIRSELWNGSGEPYAFTIADSAHWGKRRQVPFVPVAGQGYLQPSLDLLELSRLWQPAKYVAAATPSSESPAVGVVACSEAAISGVNDLEISALGTPLSVVAPGQHIAYERLLVTSNNASPSAGPAPAVHQLVAARARLFGETKALSVRGKILAGGLPFGGDVRRASVMLFSTGLSTAAPLPQNVVVPKPDGRFELIAQADGVAGFTIEVWSFGRLVHSQAVPASGELGDIAVPEPGRVQLSVTENGSPIFANVAFHPADEMTRTSLEGTLHGRQAACAPWLGPPNGASPACNRVVVTPRGEEVEVPVGKYLVVATGGPERTLAKREVEVVAGEIAIASFDLAPLPIRPHGWLSADLHVHGRASFDSGLPDLDRVRSFVANSVDVIAATDHDVIADYADAVTTLGLGDKVAVMGGLETTQLIPWLDLPGATLPKVIGHFNFWPLRPIPGEPRGGAPWDELVEPGELFDRMDPLLGAEGMRMMNHPWDEPFFGRDLGYLRAIGYDPRQPITSESNRALLNRPGGGHRNMDWNLFEMINGADSSEFQKSRVLWWSLIAEGHVVAATGNSDSHSLNDSQMGWSRNWVDAATTVGAFDAKRFNLALTQGRFVAGNGVVVTAQIQRGGSLLPVSGIVAVQPLAGDTVHIEVRAAPWVPVEQVRVVTKSGERVLLGVDQLLVPSDPFGTAGTTRLSRDFTFAELGLDVTSDDFLIVEAGMPLLAAADFDDDGVPDTTDNNRDGVVTRADIEKDEDAGPWENPPNPTDPRDSRYWVTRVIPSAYPSAFTNPMLFDHKGDGWYPPGVQSISFAKRSGGQQ